MTRRQSIFYRALESFLAWLDEPDAVPQTPESVSFKLERQSGNTMIFSIVLPAEDPADQITKRTLTASLNGAAPVTQVVTPDQTFTFNAGDVLVSTLVTTNVVGDSSPGPSATFTASGPLPTAVPKTPGAVSFTLVTP